MFRKDHLDKKRCIKSRWDYIEDRSIGIAGLECFLDDGLIALDVIKTLDGDEWSWIVRQADERIGGNIVITSFSYHGDRDFFFQSAEEAYDDIMEYVYRYYQELAIDEGLIKDSINRKAEFLEKVANCGLAVILSAGISLGVRVEPVFAATDDYASPAEQSQSYNIFDNYRFSHLNIAYDENAVDTMVDVLCEFLEDFMGGNYEQEQDTLVMLAIQDSVMPGIYGDFVNSDYGCSFAISGDDITFFDDIPDGVAVEYDAFVIDPCARTQQLDDALQLTLDNSPKVIVPMTYMPDQCKYGMIHVDGNCIILRRSQTLTINDVYFDELLYRLSCANRNSRFQNYVMQVEQMIRLNEQKYGYTTRF